MKKLDILDALEPVVEVFENLGVPYYIGGSVASSAHGMPRSTLDVDMAAKLKRQHVRPLIKVLEPAYYIDEEMIMDAIARRSSFNLVHLETMIKVDVFVSRDRPYDRQAFQRKRKHSLEAERADMELYLASAEDIVLNKLDWFRIGGEVSEQQWRDVQGVLKVQKGLLDMEYLRQWAADLGLADLLERALGEAEI